MRVPRPLVVDDLLAVHAEAEHLERAAHARRVAAAAAPPPLHLLLRTAAAAVVGAVVSFGGGAAAVLEVGDELDRQPARRELAAVDVRLVPQVDALHVESRLAHGLADRALEHRLHVREAAGLGLAVELALEQRVERHRPHLGAEDRALLRAAEDVARLLDRRVAVPRLEHEREALEVDVELLRQDPLDREADAHAPHQRVADLERQRQLLRRRELDVLEADEAAAQVDLDGFGIGLVARHQHLADLALERVDEDALGPHRRHICALGAFWWQPPAMYADLKRRSARELQAA